MNADVRGMLHRSPSWDAKMLIQPLWPQTVVLLKVNALYLKCYVYLHWLLLESRKG